MKPDDIPDDPDLHPAGGWGSLKAVSTALLRQRSTAALQALPRQNKPDGFACVSCAWAKPGHPHPAEFCENGAKATAWELTRHRAPPDFFARHPVSGLRTCSDLDLEMAGRLTAPMRYDAASDCYVEIGWDEAFAAIGAELKAIAPKSAVFYTSGRASLEASYLWQLMARLYGTNNLPDSSNMCHESTSVALPETIGVPVGTVTLDDFEATDCVFFFGQNVGTNSPRMLHDLQAIRQRGAPIVTFNPLREAGLVHFVNPQSPREMLTQAETEISTQYLQLSVGGDIAAITGVGKALLALDDAARGRGEPGVLDHAFIQEHTRGFDKFCEYLRATGWEAIAHASGLRRDELEQAAATFARAKAVIAVYGMGITQHREGVLNVQMISNLLLMGGHIGRPGAGICPVRGHSNVQGQRTVGITEKPNLAPLDKLAELYRFEPPREKGLNTVEACKGILDGSVQAFLGLGGNFLRAVPDTDRMEAAWPRMRLQVHVATKLNRSHLLPGAATFLLPCLGRIEIDRQAGNEQTVSVEGSTGHFHASHGVAQPAADSLRSEPAIVAGMALATLAANPHVPWNEWLADYARIRDAIEATWPDIFKGFNQRFTQPGGMHRPIPARQRVWKTPTGKAQFVAPQQGLDPDPDVPTHRAGVLNLMTLRSDDQFNTTVYSLDDRFRGVHGTRRVLLLHPADIARLGLEDGCMVTASSAVEDGHARSIGGMRVQAYGIPEGCAAGYFPECNPLLPLSHHARGSFVPAAKAIPIRLTREAGGRAACRDPLAGSPRSWGGLAAGHPTMAAAAVGCALRSPPYVAHVTAAVRRKNSTTCALNSRWNAARSKPGASVQISGAACRSTSGHGGRKEK